MGSRISSTIEPGRKYDIDFVNFTDQGIQGLAQFNFGTRTNKTTGLVKAVNKFIKIYLTDKGSDPYNKELGTFSDDLRSMGASSDAELQAFISSQVADALAQLKVIQATNAFPRDENITQATLVSLTRVNSESITYKIKVLSEAGEYATVLLPNIGG